MMEPHSYHKHSVAAGVLVIAIGVMLLIKNINPALDFGVTWPIFVIAAGFMVMCRHSGEHQ